MDQPWYTKLLSRNILWWILLIIFCWPVLLIEFFAYRKDKNYEYKGHLSSLSSGIACAFTMFVVYTVVAMAVFLS